MLEQEHGVMSAAKTSVVSAAKTSLVSAAKTSLVSAARTSAVSASQDISGLPRQFNEKNYNTRAAAPRACCGRWH